MERFRKDLLLLRFFGVTPRSMADTAMETIGAPEHSSPIPPMAPSGSETAGASEHAVEQPMLPRNLGNSDEDIDEEVHDLYEGPSPSSPIVGSETRKRKEREPREARENQETQPCECETMNSVGTITDSELDSDDYCEARESTSVENQHPRESAGASDHAAEQPMLIRDLGNSKKHTDESIHDRYADPSQSSSSGGTETRKRKIVSDFDLDSDEYCEARRILDSADGRRCKRLRTARSWSMSGP